MSLRLRSATDGEAPATASPASAGERFARALAAYYLTDGPRITWMRVLCSGYQPLPA